MSLEAALDEERRDILALLEGRPAISKATARARAASPAGIPQSPVRSMLDIDDPPPSAMMRHASVAGQGVGITTPGSATFPNHIRSMLDTSSPPPTPGQRPTSVSPPLTAPSTSTKLDPVREYNFEILPTNEHASLPKRVTQGGKKEKKAMSGIFGSVDNNHRSDGLAQLLGRSHKSHSPAGIGRSSSPATRRLNSNSSSLMTGSNVYVSESGQVIDMNSAYRRLSDAALLRAGGSLAKTLPSRKGSDPAKGEQMAPDGGVRLTKDPPPEDAIESTDEGESDSSDEEWTGEKRRGRGRTRKGEAADDEAKVGRKVKSQMAAAEEERKALAATHTYSSLLEPEVTVTPPPGETLAGGKRNGIHPRTSFDTGVSSGRSTPVDTDDEAEMDDIRRAQRLTMTMSPIKSDPAAHRCVRQIIRGEYQQVTQEGHKGLRRQRMYLVATDLSEEAAYALEWTIGTVLRDGDTLLAVYAVDEEVGTGASEESKTIGIGEGAKMMKDTASVVKGFNEADSLTIPPVPPSPLLRSTAASDAGVPDLSPGPLLRSSTPARQRPDLSGMQKVEKERWLATEAITDRCIALLRKTKLQVRIVIEVFHCKSPRHMITEVIDYLEPTLVILGSRGRSALKGVLLGSFSNYLVTKSSVPVMVARKKLRANKKTKPFRRANIRLSNVLQGPSTNRRLEDAKIDKVMARTS